MRNLIPLRLKTLRASACAPLCHTALLAVLATAFLPAPAVQAQEKATNGQETAHAGQRPQTVGSGMRRPIAGQTTGRAEALPAAHKAPAAPPAPLWPVNQKPLPAHIVWDSHGLRIEASNSSLDQILHDVSINTGVKIEGFSKDQRIFGTYGPGPARDVLSHLLDGSGYNVLMVGGVGNAPPSRIVLSAESPAGPQPPPDAQSQQDSEDDNVEAEQPPQEQPAPQPMPVPQQTPQPTPIRNPFGDSPRMQIPMGGGPPMFGQPTTMPPDQNSNPQQ